LLAVPIAILAILGVAGPPLRAQGLDPGKAISQYNLDVWTSELSLPQNSVTAVVQARDGYLWLGTYGGLVRFDGVQFTVFQQGRSEGLASNSIQALLEDRQGNLWIGTNGGGLSRFKDGVFTSFDTDDGLANDIVRTLFEDSRGTLWIGTNDGLSRFQEGRLVSYTTRDGLSNGVIRAISEEPAGVLWVGTNGGGLVRFSNGRFEAITTRDGLPSNFVFALRRDREGRLWIGTNGGGLCRKEGERLLTYTTRDGLGSDIIWSLEEDGRGSLWVGTYGGGLCRLRDRRFSCFSSRQGLSNDFVRALLADREGSLWIGTYSGGLNRLRDGKVTTYTKREGLADDFARAIFEDSEGTLWIGTTGGGLSRFRDGKFRTYGPGEGVGSDVRALHETPDGALWIGSAGHGLARLERGRFRRYTTGDGLAHMNVSALASDRDGALWVGTNGGGLSRLREGGWTTWTARDGLAGNFIMAALVDREGAIWVGTDGSGLGRFKDGRFTTYTRRQGLASDIVFALHEDANGALWIGTAGGLSRFRNGRFETLTTRNGLLDDVVFQILEDAGSLWVSGNHGISRVARADLEAALADPSRSVSPAAYGTADGMKSRECSGVAQPAGIRTRQGQLWFPTARGVVMIDPTRNPRNTLPPSVKIEQVQADGQPVGPVVSPGKERWEFRYTGLSFLAPQKVLFKYKLEGFDHDWVPADTRRVAYYTRIPPGHYTFRVIACNNDGVWNDTGDRVRFTLRPYFHQTGWFYGIVGVSVALAGAGLVRLRVRSLEAHKRELEALVEARTRDLVRQKERTEAALRETERQKEIALEADNLKTEMLSIAAHDLKTPLQSIIGFAELTAALPGLPANVSEFPDHCGRAARRMVEIIDRLLDAAAIEQGKLVLERKAVDLGRLALAQAGIHQRMAESKKQRIHVEVEDGCLVQGDESSLRQVIDNLLSNAIKFSPPRRSVWVSVRKDAASTVLEVRDEGPGLTPADRERLFGRFQRLSARPTGGESSTGLGLSIVKQLVELQHGRIRAESEGPGKGSRFVVELPGLLGPAPMHPPAAGRVP
jgi:ligand-binding sensor domain-containing protein/signal transduction histidine kinase